MSTSNYGVRLLRKNTEFDVTRGVLTLSSKEESGETRIIARSPLCETSMLTLLEVYGKPRLIDQRLFREMDTINLMDGDLRLSGRYLGFVLTANQQFTVPFRGGTLTHATDENSLLAIVRRQLFAEYGIDLATPQLSESAEVSIPFHGWEGTSTKLISWVRVPAKAIFDTFAERGSPDVTTRRVFVPATTEGFYHLRHVLDRKEDGSRVFVHCDEEYVVWKLLQELFESYLQLKWCNSRYINKKLPG